MNAKVTLKIETKEEFLALMEALYDRKLIGGYYYLRDGIQKATYPMEIPLDVDKLLDMVFQPTVIKMFGHKIRPALLKGLETVVEGT